MQERILPTSDGDTNGILHKKLVNFTANGETAVGVISNVNDNNLLSYWCSANKGFSTLQVSFANGNISLTNYTIRVGNWNVNDAYPKEWVMSGFNGIRWESLSVVKKSGVNAANKSKTFQTTNSHSFYSSIKITQTGRNYFPTDSYHLCIADFELFGYITKTPEKTKAAPLLYNKFSRFLSSLPIFLPLLSF